MLRYLKLWLQLARNNLLRQLEYRSNLAGRILIEIVWISTQVLFFKTLYAQTGSIGGWTEGEIYLFVGSLYFVDGLQMILMHDNQQKFSDSIRNGLFDFYLLRPVSTLFLSLFRYVNVACLFNLVVALGLMVWPFATGLLVFSWTTVGILAVYLPLGFLLLTCMLVFILSIGFWATQTSNLLWLFYEIYRLGWRPEGYYAPWLRRVLLSVFPAAFFISVPVQLALGKLGGAWFLAPWAFVGLGLMGASFLWKRGLRNYEGALS